MAETGTGSDTGTGSADPDIVIAGLSKTVRRQRVFLAAACVAALAAGGGLVASTMIESPAQQAAETKPPKPAVLTAPVVKKVLTDTVTTRGTVGAGGDITVSPVASGGGGSSAGGAVSLVASKLYAKAGDQIRAGQVLIEVSGRPIIALSGAVPAYRDLKPGMDGPDVAQLQAALKQLGHDSAPDTLGHFGDGTKSALTDLYTALGYSVPTTGGANDTGDSSALQAAADAVTAQQRTVDTDYGLLQKANQALASAKKGLSPPTTSPTSGSGPGAGPSAGLGQSPLQAAQEAQQTAQTTYDNALQDLGKAEKKQSDLTATTGPMLPASEVIFVPSFPVRLAKLNATLGSTVTAPLLTLESGRLVVASLLQPGQNSLVKPGVKVQLTAEALGQTATANVTSIGPYSDGSASNGQNGNGQNSGTGGAAAGPSNGQASGSNATGGQQPTQLPGYPMTVTPDSPLNPAWAGQDVRVTIINAATTSAVLTVPLSAVSTGADGHATVTVVAADGTQRRIPVTAGASADGDVEVTPADAGALREGEAVAIGQAPQ
ncbi:peptidoglycan-binding protein [Catenulispora sp. GAS73]|uniref:peptidoglycan-binding protein n=1 Tax=Catenulispora sp. GAS73 TaxID=3156269 RepID=UPI0035138E22